MMKEDEVFLGLAKFGLSSYEIKAYSCLLLNGPLTATDVVKKTGIPQPRVYDVFTSLSQRELITVSSGIKKIYRAISPERGLMHEIESMGNYVMKLGEYVDRNKVEHDPIVPKVWIIESKTRTFDMMEASINEAKHEILMSLPLSRLRDLGRPLKKANNRGVTISSVIYSDVGEKYLEELRKYSIVRRREGHPPEILLIDRETCMVNVGSMVEGSNYSIWIEENELVHVMNYYFFFMLWTPSHYLSDFSIKEKMTFTTSWLACEAIDVLLSHKATIRGSVIGKLHKSGSMSHETVTIDGYITGVERIPGVRQTFFIEDGKKRVSVGGRTSTIEDIRLQSVTLMPSYA